MDEHKKKEENKFCESSEQQQPRLNREAKEEDNSEESMDQHQAGYKEGRNAEEEEEPAVQLKEVETGSEEAASSPPSLLGIFANPCSLLQYLLRACARWCRAPLRGASDEGRKRQQAAAAVAPEAVAPANSTEQGGGGGGEKQAGNYFYMQEVVTTRVWAVRRGRPPAGRPGPPREGRGGNGGVHH